VSLNLFFSLCAWSHLHFCNTGYGTYSTWCTRLYVDGCILGCILCKSVQPSIQLLVVFALQRNYVDVVDQYKGYYPKSESMGLLSQVNRVEILHRLYFLDNVKVSLFYTTLSTTL
jgi:hypothetical protein